MGVKDYLYEGETVNITPYRNSDIPLWSSWFNNQTITKRLDQGRFPTSESAQLNFALGAEADGRIIFMIRGKTEELLGTISISNINHWHRSADIAIVCPPLKNKPRFAAVEGMALVVNHGFKVLGLNRISAGQVINGLETWIKKLVVLGFKVEGIKKSAFFDGENYFDTLMMGIIRQKFYQIESNQNSFWPGSKFFEEKLIKQKNLDYDFLPNIDN